jgi:protein-disulfide isomerase/uncharacterized membrane protein
MYKTIAAYIVLVALGLGLSGYLLLRHYTLATTSGPVGPSTCSVLLKHDCDGALQSAMSRQFGLPLAGWGVVYYGTLAALLLVGWFLGDAIRSEAALAALVLSTFGAALSVVLFLTMTMGKAPFCPLCAATHVINLLLLPTCKRLTGKPVPQLLRALGAGIASVLGGNTVSSAAGRIKILGMLAVTLIAAVIYQWLFIQEKLHPPAEFDVNRAVAMFALSARVEIPIGDDDSRLGPADAWVQVVVFTDFQCQGCRRLAAELGPMVEAYHPRVQVVFKHFPVSKTCNPALKNDPHPRACEAAWAAEASRRQKKFWAYHDALFATNLETDQTIAEVAGRVGLDLTQFETDRWGDKARAKVKADVELGMRLGLDETPAIFVNGRRAPDVRMQALNLFVLSEIASRSPRPIPALDGAKTSNDGK